MGRVLGIIGEYNPFHNGHMYHIQASKKQTGAEYVVAVMSGNFVQRGNTSIINKWSKTQMALLGGIDLIIELPVLYSISSAENFAEGAIKILNELNVVDSISFGTEAENIATLNNIANVLYEEPKGYTSLLNHELGRGVSYPKARQSALMMYLNDIKRYANVLSGSNNILAIEYLKALKRTRSKIVPYNIKREKVYYNDQKIVDEFASSTAIRNLIRNNQWNDIKKVVPARTYDILCDSIYKGQVVLDLEIFSKEIIYCLRTMDLEDIKNLPEVGEGLENLIKTSANECNTVMELIEKIKSKRYTQTRIQRILLYALLGIEKQDMEMSRKITPYVRVLGFNEKGRRLLSEISVTSPKIHMITSVKKFMETNKNKNETRMFELDKLATDIYTIGYQKKSSANLDYTMGMSILQ